jgi:KaiC/GvpD/RAD55 family RecA-like ATPase
MELENPQKQKLLIEYLISSVDVFSLCQPILQVKYFDITLEKTVKFLLDYYNQYRAIPSISQIKAETGLQLTTHELTRDQTEYCIKETELFCRRSAIKKSILDSVTLYEDEDYGQIESNLKNAIATSVHKRAGVGLFEDIDEILLKLEQQPALPSGYTEFDEVLGGGLRRKELLLLSANSGGGKSIVMANFALNYLLSDLHILYLSFELPVEMISKRYLSMVTGIGQRDIIDRSSEISTIMKQAQTKTANDLIIERLPAGTTPNQVRAFLKEFELRRKYVPDLIVFDYIDLMSPNEKVSADNVFEKDKRVTEQVCEILVDYDMIGITASQQNRSAVTTNELNHSHIAGGISKINTTDIYVSIVFNDMMRAAGEIHFEFLKTRSSDGVGKRVELAWNSKTLRVENPKNTSGPLTFSGKKTYNNSAVNKQSSPEEKHITNLRNLIDI